MAELPEIHKKAVPGSVQSHLRALCDMHAAIR